MANWTEDLAILEQLDLDYNDADQASDAERFGTLLARTRDAPIASVRSAMWPVPRHCAPPSLRARA